GGAAPLGERPGLGEKEGVPASLGLAHQRIGGVRVRRDPLERVHDEEHFHFHRPFATSTPIVHPTIRRARFPLDAERVLSLYNAWPGRGAQGLALSRGAICLWMLKRASSHPSRRSISWSSISRGPRSPVRPGAWA